MNLNPELKRYLPAVYIIGGAIFLFLFISWLISPKYPSFTLRKTPFSQENHPVIQGDKVYSYSGAAFSSVHREKPEDIQILASGMRLPAMKQLFWGAEEGALVVFDTSAQTDGSLLEKELMARGLFVDELTADYVWYIDFSSKTLHLASTSPLGSANAYYSPTKKGFYFTTLGPDGSLEVETEVKPPLRFFSTATKKSETVMPDVGLGIVHHIGACGRGDLCMIQDNQDNKQSLWAVEKGNKKLLSNTYDQVLATNLPSIYVGEKNEPIVNAEESEDLLLYADLFLINLEKDKTTPLNTKVSVGAETSINASKDAKKLVITDDSLQTKNGTSTYTQTAPDIFGSSKSKQTPYSLDDGELKERIIKPISSVTSDVQLLLGSEEGIYLMSPGSYNFRVTAYDEKELSEKIKPCLGKHTKYHKYSPELHRMVVGVVYNDNFQATIANFSSCVEKTDKKAFVGQTYIFIGLSPTDGRFVTN